MKVKHLLSILLGIILMSSWFVPFEGSPIVLGLHAIWRILSMYYVFYVALTVTVLYCQGEFDEFLNRKL